MIDKPLYSTDPNPPGSESPAVAELVEVVIETPGEEAEDGEVLSPPPCLFGDNLAEFIEDGALRSMATELLQDFDSDKRSRSDWEKSYQNGIELLGLKFEERGAPWAGACGVYHPILAEAVIRFQSQAITEIFPASGPVKTAIIGKKSDEVEAQARRVQEDMNYWLTEKMTEYRDETEQLLFNLPLAGSAFRKVFYDEALGRPSAMFVPAEDFVMPYGYTRLETCPRYSHIMRKPSGELEKLMAVGFYRSLELQDPLLIQTETQRKESKLTGQSQFEINSAGLHTVIEMHVDLSLEGFDEEEYPLPYVVTFLKEQQEVLSVRRNWKEGDPLHRKRVHFTHYKYIPGMGSYGFGLIHLIGGIAKGATSLLRQLIDAGTLSNLPGGFKSKDLRVKGDNTPLRPGEWRDADVTSGSLREAFFTLPYKEPSPVLYQLLGNLIDEGRRFASIADINVGESNQQAPVGTTLALIERSMKVVGAIQARLHAAQRQEFKLLAQIIGENIQDYEYDPESGGREIHASDYDERIDVLPVSDPNASSMAMRIMQAQSVLQLSQQAPQLYDLPALHRRMLTAMGIDGADQLIPDKSGAKPADPMAENINLMTSKPVKVYPYQDHEAHIEVHLALLNDPKTVKTLQTSQLGGQLKASMDAHIAEHLAYAQRDRVEMQIGVPIPLPGTPMPPEMERSVAGLMAQGSKKALNAARMQQDAAAAQAAAQDPLIKMQQQELQIEASKVQADTQAKMADLQLKAKQHADKMALADKQIQASLAQSQLNAQVKTQISEKDREADFAKEALRGSNPPQGGRR
jgi:chaperonin GroES